MNKWNLNRITKERGRLVVLVWTAYYMSSGLGSLSCPFSACRPCHAQQTSPETTSFQRVSPKSTATHAFHQLWLLPYFGTIFICPHSIIFLRLCFILLSCISSSELSLCFLPSDPFAPLNQGKNMTSLPISFFLFAVKI